MDFILQFLLCQEPSSQIFPISYLYVWLGFGSCHFSIPLLFHFTFFYSKTSLIDIKLGGSLHYCLKNLCSIFHLNLMSQSKVIRLPVRVSNVVINGDGGTWYYVETIYFLINIWVSFGLPFTLCMYINPIYLPI